jgi:hypothetical protein
MEKAIAVLCVLVIGVSTVDGVVDYSGVDLPGFTPQDKEEGDIEWSDIKEVTMPENKIREVMHYDHIIRIELYWENKTSGEWTYWALDVSGQELIKIPGTKTMIDGYSEDHSTMYLRRELSAQFTVFMDDSEGESVTADGEYDVQRDEYMDLGEEIMVRIDTNANISVDELPSTNIPLSFRGFTRSYFDPHLPAVETLEDAIYGEGQTIKLGDTGDWVDDTSWNEVTYDWVAERGEIIAGYDTVLINVSTDYGSDDWSLPFMELVWISNEVSYPVKQFIRTNTSWDGEEEAGFILLENTFELRNNGFTEGSSAIPNNCQGFHWLDEHPLADTESWSGNFMPLSSRSDSDWEESSFHWKPEEVIDWIEEKHESDDLALFLSENPDSIVTNAQYNASLTGTDPLDIEGEFWWNLTFGHEGEEGQGWGAENRYRVLVYNETIYEGMDRTDPLNPVPIYNIDISFLEDYGKQGGSSPLNPSDILSQTVTMASSEKIFKTDDKVMENFYPYENLGVTELDWEDGDGAEYSLGTSSGEQGFGMDLIATLTGIQTQTWGKYTWSLAQEDLMEGGTLSSCSLDAETGRLISYMEIEGTALANAFNW